MEIREILDKLTHIANNQREQIDKYLAEGKK